MTSVSTLGLQLLSTTSLQAEQTNMALLSNQLASNQQHNNLTDYSPLQAQQLINFQGAITQRQAYVSAMQTVSPRLSVYDSTMTDMESIASQAAALANQNPSQDPSTTGVVQQQVVSFMQEAVADLNQQVGGRYIYAGTRYTTQPVNLNSVLTNFSPSATVTTNPDLPSYDSQFGTATPEQEAQAWTNDSVAIDTGDNLTYGVSSVQGGFQQLIAGMQFINSATQPGTTAADYKSDMSQGAALLKTALTTIQTYHAGVASAINTVSNEQTTQQNDISTLQQQIGNIQNVDLTQIGTELNLLQTQLQASYSATATLTQESILKYL